MPAKAWRTFTRHFRLRDSKEGRFGPLARRQLYCRSLSVTAPEDPMSADSTAFDPYRSPSLPEGPYAGKPPAGKPGWLTALCAICIVLGVLGLLNTLFGTITVIVGPSMQKALTPKGTPGVPAGLERAQQQLNDDLAAVL